MEQRDGGGRGGRDEKWLLGGYRVLLWADGNVLALGKSGGCSVVAVLNATELSTLK